MNDSTVKTSITPAKYIQAFRDYASVVAPGELAAAGVERLMEPVAALPNQEVARPISELCGLTRSHWKNTVNRDRFYFGRTDVEKSALLFRLIYLQEPLRQVRCPIHKGRQATHIWAGLGPPCAAGCQGTGWLHADPGSCRSVTLGETTWVWDATDSEPKFTVEHAPGKARPQVMMVQGTAVAAVARDMRHRAERLLNCANNLDRFTWNTMFRDENPDKNRMSEWELSAVQAFLAYPSPETRRKLMEVMETAAKELRTHEAAKKEGSR